MKADSFLLSSTQTWAELSCGHRILWFEDDDVTASQYCRACGLYCMVEGFV